MANIPGTMQTMQSQSMMPQMRVNAFLVRYRQVALDADVLVETQ